MEPVSIFLDLETTDLKPVKIVQPVQLAARAVMGDTVRIFNKYMNPSISIAAGSSNVHHLYLVEGQLVRVVDGVEEELEGVVSVKTGLELFWDWVEEMGRLQPDMDVYMVCYSYNKFDIQVKKFYFRPFLPK